MSSTDAALLERWQRRRDADAFAELVQRHSGMVMSSCRRILGDASLAEDVAQECFIALMQSQDAVRASLGAWLHTIAVRRSIDRIRGDSRRRKREAVFAEDHITVPAPDVSVDEILAHVDEAIAELPEAYRAAVVGRLLLNRTHIDLARDLNVAESTIRYRVEKGVNGVRQTLRRKGVAISAAGLAVALSQTVEAAPAALLVRLGKLAMSGSIAAKGGASLSAALLAKSAVALAAALIVGAMIWTGVAHYASDGRAADRSITFTPASVGATPAAESVNDEPFQPVVSGQARIPAATTPPDSKPFSIRGRVYDVRSGKGIAGVRVHVYPAGGGVHAGESDPTESDGNYLIDPLDDGMYSVSLGDIEGYPNPRGNHRTSVTLKDRRPVSGIDFALEPGLPVSGIVIGSDGQPVVGADVAAATPSTPNPIRTESLEEGLFKLYMPDVSDSLRVQAQSEHAESGVEGVFPLTDEGLEGVVLMLDRPRSASVSGSVVDATGNPMAGAQLHFFRKDGSIFAYGTSGETGKDGRFQISSLVSTEYSVVVTPKGVSVYSTADEYARVHPEPGETLEGIEIVYGEKGGMAIAGRVIDSAGRPVAHARVMSFGGHDMQNAYTDDDGAFALTGLDDATYGLTVEHDDYSRSNGRFPAGTSDVEIVLKGRGTLAGRVVRADNGQALTAYTLAFYMAEASGVEEMPIEAGQSIESADGTFSFGQMQDGRFTVAAWAPGFAPELQHVDVVENKATDVELRLTEVPPFEGTVVNKAGEPVSNAAVYFVSGVSLDRLDRAASDHSDAQGRFRIESLPLTATRLCAYTPGYGAGFIKLPGENQIVLPGAAAVNGTIQIDGALMGDLYVNAYYPEASYLPGTHQKPESDGSFHITGMSEGLLRINVAQHGPGNQRSVTKTIEVRGGDDAHVEIVFDRGAAMVEGTVSVEGVPLDLGYLALERRRGDTTETIRATLGTDGSFRFDEVWAGNLVLSITRVDPDDPYEPIVHEFDLVVADAQVLRQDIELPPIR